MRKSKKKVFFIHTLRIFICFAVVVLTCFQELYAQGTGKEQQDLVQLKIDSILNCIDSKTPANLKSKYYNQIALIAINIDTVKKYSLLSLEFCDKKENVLIAENYKRIAWYYSRMNEPRKAWEYMKKSISLVQKTSDEKLLAEYYKALAQVFRDMNKSDSAYHYFNKSLQISAKLNDSASVASCYEALGRTSSDMNFYQEAEKYYWKAMEIDSITGNMERYAMDLFRLGELIVLTSDTSYYRLSAAKYYLSRAICLQDSIETDQKYNSYGLLANVFIKLAEGTNDKKYADSCRFYCREAALFLLKNGYYNDYLDVTYTYVEYMKFYKRYDEALNTLIDLKKYLSDEESLLKLGEYYGKLKEIYYLLGDYKNAYEAVIKEYKCALANINDSSMTVLADAKTEQNMMLERLDRENDEKLHREQTSRMRLLLVSLLIGSGLILRVFFVKREANKELMVKNEILHQQKTEIEAQRDEIENQRNEIVGSLGYAQRIQRAAIPSEEDINKLFPNNFVYYCPRDIVSGDFYYAAKCGKYKVFVVADCTGHGVPGGFLSMLGISSLKEFLVTEQDAENPGIVMDEMKAAVLNTLVNSADDGLTVSDGMDMIICCFDFENLKLYYSAANLKGCIIRNLQPIKLIGDKMPVGRYYYEKDHFTTFTMDLQKGDIIYMYTDGIQDQFGGPGNDLGVKFSGKKLLALLIEINSRPLSEQKNIIDDKIEKWRNGRSQTDDMTMAAVIV